MLCEVRLCMLVAVISRVDVIGATCYTLSPLGS